MLNRLLFFNQPKTTVMKKIYFLVYITFFATQLSAQTITFSDINLKNTLLSAGPNSSVAWDNNNTRVAVDVDGDGEIQQSEALLIDRLQLENAGIQDVNGIEFFTNIRNLLLSGNPITDLDVTMLNNLEQLSIHQSAFVNVNFTNLINLKAIYAFDNPISNFDFTGVNALETLVVGFNDFTSLNLSMVANLKELTIYDNALTGLDLSNQLVLETIFISNSQITSIDISNLQSLIDFTLRSSQLTALDASNLSALETLYVSNNNITSISLNNNTSLLNLDAGSNQLNTLDIAQASNLTGLNLFDNQLTTLDLTVLTDLNNLVLDNNQLTFIDVSTNDNISGISASNNNLEMLDVSNLTNLIIMEVDNNNLTSLNIENSVLSQEVDNHFFDGNPDLTQICVDEGELTFIQQRALDYGYVYASVEVCSLLGVSANIAGKVKIYPNPCADFITVEVENITPISLIEIYNVQGQLVLSSKQAGDHIDTSALQNGIYLLKIETSEGSVNKRFIKS